MKMIFWCFSNRWVNNTTVSENLIFPKMSAQNKQTQAFDNKQWSHLKKWHSVLYWSHALCNFRASEQWMVHTFMVKYTHLHTQTRSISTAETDVMGSDPQNHMVMLQWLLPFLSNLPMQNQEQRDRNVHQDHFVLLHRHINKSSQKPEPIKTARETEEQRERDYWVQQIDQEQWSTLYKLWLSMFYVLRWLQHLCRENAEQRGNWQEQQRAQAWWRRLQNGGVPGDGVGGAGVGGAGVIDLRVHA